MKKTIITLVLALAVFLGTTAFIVKYSNGIAGWTGSPGEGYCNNCHGGGYSATSGISIYSAPAFSLNQFVPGTTYTITVNVAASGFTKFGFGCEILDASFANVGTLQAINSPLDVYFLLSGGRKNAVHKAPRGGQDSASFSFRWIAPATGDTATIYASGNAVNGDGNTTGDFPLTPVMLQLNAQPKAPDTTSTVGIKELKMIIARDVSLYPNPATNLSAISYSLDQDQQVSVQLMDLYGKIIKEFVNEMEIAGSHSHFLGLQGTPPGVYFVKLSANNKNAFQQMLLVN